MDKVSRALRRVQIVSCIIFDLDGTLIDSNRAYDLALKDLGLDSLNSEYLSARALVKKRLPAGHVAARNRLLYFKSMAEAANKFSASNVLQAMNRYELALRAEIDRQWNEGRAQVLRELAQNNHLFLATNENLRTQLIKLEVIDPHGKIFKKTLMSEEVGEEKPGILFFNEIKKIVDCAPEHCLFVGDDEIADLEPAKKMGMKTCLTVEFKSEPQASIRNFRFDLSISKLSDLPAALKTIWK